MLAPDRPREPNPECPVCGVFNATITVDLSRATLNDVVEDFLKEQVGLGEREFVLNNDVGVIYDADETDNLPKKLTDLGKPEHVLPFTDKRLTCCRHQRWKFPHGY